MKILLDTSVFISIFAEDRYSKKSIDLFKKVLEKHEGFFCSMTINELVWVLKKSGYDGKFIKGKIDFIFSSPIKFLPASYEVFQKSIDLMERYNLGYGDAQIAAHVITNRLEVLASFDSDFDRVKEIERKDVL